MAVIEPFVGVRYDPRRVRLGKVLCPPYDVIPPDQARRLRRNPLNAVHLELPEGRGAAKYRSAARQWKKLNLDGVVVQDPEPALYVCEERFWFAGRSRRRLGFLAGLGLKAVAARAVVPHEKTLSKPKADRLNLLKAVGVNVSPIFGLFEDPRGSVRRILIKASRAKPVAVGRMPSGTRYRLWRVSNPSVTGAVSRALRRSRILIADGHHRFEVGRRYWQSLARGAGLSGAGRGGAATILAYLCADEDPGLVTLGYHRVIKGGLLTRASRLCSLTRCRTLSELETRLGRSRNPCAFGIVEGGCYLAEPADTRGAGGLGVKWIRDRLLSRIDPEKIVYTHDASGAAAAARRCRGAAVLVRPMSVAEIRRAVARIGLLPQKSTYFFPKVATGLVFKPLSAP